MIKKSGLILLAGLSLSGCEQQPKSGYANTGGITSSGELLCLIANNLAEINNTLRELVCELQEIKCL